MTLSLKVIALSLTAAALAGCAATPMSVFQSTYSDTKATSPRIFQSKSNLEAASKCAMKNIEDRIASFYAFYSQEPARPGTKEIRVRSEVGVAAVVEIAETASGSTISVWISNHYPLKGLLSERISNGC
jgi:hypothetical protein